jgi:hypothetical protein
MRQNSLQTSNYTRFDLLKITGECNYVMKPRHAAYCPSVPPSKAQIHRINLPNHGPFTDVSVVGKHLAKYRALLSRTEAL